MAKAKLIRVGLKIPSILDAAWEADEAEELVLRDLVDQLRTRRALEVGRGTAREEPVPFLNSLLELRGETRKLLQRLPLKATASRSLILHVSNRLGDILDAFTAGITRREHRRMFTMMGFHEQMEVMDDVWDVVEAVRRDLDLVAAELEKELRL
jgi:hypothetical protein